MISPYAKVNYVDHTVTDQSSILRFIEDNWNLGRIGDSSMDAVAGPLNGMFNFSAPAAAALFLEPSTGLPVAAASTQAAPSTGNGNNGTSSTTAVAYPKNATVTVNAIQLDGAASSSFDRKALTYSWSLAPGSLAATITDANTATPTVTFTAGAGSYSFLLTVSDDAGNSSIDTATVIYASH